MNFTIVPRSERTPKSGKGEAFLRVDMWNDYSFVTMFEVILFDYDGKSVELGNVKIGYSSQTEEIGTYQSLDAVFQAVPRSYFSLGQDVEYYKKLSQDVSAELMNDFLVSLRDIVKDDECFETAAGHEVFKTSLLRTVSISSVTGQFRRVLAGGAPLTSFDFSFLCPSSPTTAGVELGFTVTADSTPSSNIHAIIGRNGVGKTTLLNDMIAAITKPNETQSRFFVEAFPTKKPVDEKYFSRLISVGFSAFDPFTPPKEQADPEVGTCYFYIGLKDTTDESGLLLKTIGALREDCISSLLECFSDKRKIDRWKAAISTLESDENFAQMQLHTLAEKSGGALRKSAEALVERMSSGHAVVLLIISRLISKVEEKSLILIDEPESHLHPPLLSALTRALSELLHQRNGVAIIATHSPVVLQEVPKSCVWVLSRSRLSMHAQEPRIETFGENVGVLTREVFGLEVAKSGFHSLLTGSVAAGRTYEEIVRDYGGQLGLEARGILRALIAERDKAFPEN